MTHAHEPDTTRPMRRQTPPPVPKRRAPGEQPPPPSASATMPIAPEDIIGELDK